MKELYGIFNKFATDNHYVNLTKTLNSVHTTRETQKTLRQLVAKQTPGLSHGAVLVIHKGICYTTFLHNYGSGGDDPFAKTIFLELGIFSLERALSEDFDREKDVRIVQLSAEEAITGDIRATSTFVCNSQCVVEDQIHFTLGTQVEGGRYVVYHTVYNPENDTFTRAKEMKLDYKGKIYPLDDVSVNAITVAEGYESDSRHMPQITNRWSEYKGYYYTTFMIDDQKGKKRSLVIRTKDFDTVEFVSIMPGTEHCDCETASFIHADQMYTACRQSWGICSMLINRYDLETGQWLESYQIEDGTSRPWFFAWQDELYLYNTIEEQKRRYANISKVRTDRKAYNHKNVQLDTVATLFDCGQYHSFYNYEDRVFFTCTLAGSVRFGELKLKLHDPEKVNDRLLALFEQI